METRANLEKLRAALNAAHNSLRRDQCGNYRLNGQYGHVYVDGAGWLMVIHCRSARLWTWTKRRLDFARVTQDGEDEGCLHLAALPTTEQAQAIRSAVGLRQTREVSSEQPGRFRKETASMGTTR